MKKNLFEICASVSTILFLGYVTLCLYVWLANSNPTDSVVEDWRSLSIGGNGIKIAHSIRLSTKQNGSAMQIYPYDGGNNFHIAVTTSWGGKLILMNQCMPSEGVMLGADVAETIKRSGWDNFGIRFIHIIHSVEKDKNWWTLMISLWYPIVIFGILPSIFIAKKLRAKAPKR